MAESVQEHFERLRSTYARYSEGLWGAYRALVHRKLAARLPAGPLRVLDIGGGALVSLPRLLAEERVELYQVVDLVDHLDPKPAKLKVHRGDAVAFAEGFSGPAFDAVVIYGVLMYLKPEQELKLARALASLLKPGGLVVVHEPNARSTAWLEKDLERPVDLDAFGQAAGLHLAWSGDFNVPWWRGLLRRTGGLLPYGPAVAAEPWLGRGLDSLRLFQKSV